MNLLILGLLIFFAIHFVPVFTKLHTSLLNSLGEKAYKGVFAVISLIGFGLLVWGKAEANFVHLWVPPVWGRHVTMITVLLALVLIMASGLPTNIKRYTRHPMLWGVVAWALGHLLANGDLASLLLFGGFGLYSLLAMRSLNLRGVVLATQRCSLKNDLIVVVGGLVLYAALLYFHSALFGVQVV